MLLPLYLRRPGEEVQARVPVGPRKRVSRRGLNTLGGDMVFLQDDDSKQQFMVDTGAVCSVLPHRSSAQPAGPQLSGTDGRSIPTWGTIRRRLSFRLRTFFVTFFLGAVRRPILGLDFLSAHGLLVDPVGRQVLDSKTLKRLSKTPTAAGALPSKFATALCLAQAVRSPLASSQPSATETSNRRRNTTRPPTPRPRPPTPRSEPPTSRLLPPASRTRPPMPPHRPQTRTTTAAHVALNIATVAAGPSPIAPVVYGPGSSTHASLPLHSRACSSHLHSRRAGDAPLRRRHRSARRRRHSGAAATGALQHTSYSATNNYFFCIRPPASRRPTAEPTQPLSLPPQSLGGTCGGAPSVPTEFPASTVTCPIIPHTCCTYVDTRLSLPSLKYTVVAWLLTCLHLSTTSRQRSILNIQF